MTQYMRILFTVSLSSFMSFNLLGQDCEQGYTLLTLSYSNADFNSFSVLNSENELMAEYNDLNGSGSIDDCFLTSDQNDCFTIDVEGGENFTWDLLVDEFILLSGDASDFEFGPECDPECVDNDSIIDNAFSTLNTCSETVYYLVSNYGYTELEACAWDGNMGSGSLFGGLIMSEFCECTCGELEDPNTNTVVDIIVNSENHNTLETAVIAAELDDDLSTDGPFTIFAPTDAAFDALPAGTVESLLLDPTGELANILLHHVYSGEAMSTNLSDGMVIPTLLGTELIVSFMQGSVMIDNAMVTMADISADNGVVHVIDVVLIPNEDGECVDDDVAAAALASLWNPNITGCVDAVPYFEGVGYPCSTDLTVLGMTGTIEDICECSCAENVSIDENYNKRELVVIKDILGRTVPKITYNIPLLFIYNDGSVQKKTIKY